MATQKIKKTNINTISNFTWCMQAPAATIANSATCGSNDDRYIYYLNGSNFYRYDTVSDAWIQLATPAIAPLTLSEMKYSTAHGYYGRTISNGGGANTIELAALNGDVFVGKKIKIISGTGAGQERTITAVSDPIIKDRGVVTSTSNNNLNDSSTGVMIKQPKNNQWKDYQVRVIYGTLANSVVRKIPYVSNGFISVGDTSMSPYMTWWGPAQAAQFSSSPSENRTVYQIESNIVTLDSNWTVQPDATSDFVIQTGGIWLISSNASSPFYSFQYYDVAADTWYQKTANAGIFTSALGTDVSIEATQESSTPIISGTITSADSSSITDSSKNLTPSLYTNYELRILSGTAKGQYRALLTNTSSTFIPVRNWDVTPSVGDTYGLFPDTSKINIIGNGSSAIAQYDSDIDFTYCGKRVDYGVARIGGLSVAGLEAISITGITRTTGGITAINPTPTAAGTGYLANQLLTLTGGTTNGMARIISVDTNGGVTQVELERCGAGHTPSSGIATTVSPSGGTGCTLEITSVGDIATIISFYVPSKMETGGTITVTGAEQSDYNGTKTVLANSASAGVQYAVSNSPTTPATFTFTQSATTLFDITKNWVNNEHVGKLVYIATGIAPATLGVVVRRITANTSNSLSFATITTAAANGTGRYVIVSDKAFGTDETIGATLNAPVGGNRSGTATSGTTTSLTDSTKNWPTNYWSNTFPTGASNTGRKIRIIKGTGAGNEMTITSNSSTTLNFTTQSFTPDQTSVYVILDCYGIVTSSGTTTLTDTTQNWGTNIFAGRRVRITGGTSVGSETTILTNTQTVLTLATSITTDTTSTYAILTPAPKSAGIKNFYIYGSTDSSLNHKYIYMFRGGGTSEISRYNISTEEVEYITTFPNFETFTTGSMYAYDGEDKIYITKESTGKIMYYDIVKNIIVNVGIIPYGMGAAIIGNRMEIKKIENGDKWLFIMRHSGQEMWRLKLN